MKFTVSYSRKVKAGKAYEMMEIFASIESDTSIETMDDAFERVKKFVNNRIDANQDELLEKSAPRPEVKKEASA